MKLLAIDIGAGTEDVLLYDDAKRNVENCIKMVLPSPHLVYAQKVREITRRRRDLLVTGDVIGGGALVAALQAHLAAGLRVDITEHAAYTVRNNLDQVTAMGFNVVKEGDPPHHGAQLVLEEVNIATIRAFLRAFHEDLNDVAAVAVAVQDHGVFPKGASNRRFRLQQMRALLEANPSLDSLAFTADRIPSCYVRMRSAVLAAARHLPDAQTVVMDTAPAAIRGCVADPALEGRDALLAINVGNGHTMAAILQARSVLGMLEHHTGMLTAETLHRYLRAFAHGTLRDDVVFQDGGHGAFYLAEPAGLDGLSPLVATGPNRQLVTRIPIPARFAAPGGDVMMTGTIGLVEAAKPLLR
jgi:uncharacterized protein (DUF1786 family)